MAMGIALAFAFTAVFVYEQYESEVASTQWCEGSCEIIEKPSLPHSAASILCNKNNSKGQFGTAVLWEKVAVAVL
ncbi:hypothetical protein CsatB_019490 [Cannabis sativa]